MDVPGVKLSLMSFTYKRSGPKTVPCGTPDRTGAGDDFAPSSRTTCFGRTNCKISGFVCTWINMEVMK